MVCLVFCGMAWMHVVIILPYLFSLWMLVDAIKRHAEVYWYLVICFSFGEWVCFFPVKIHDFKGLFGPDNGCRTCRHCAELDDDGVQCAFGGKQVFRTHVQSGYCTDHERR